MLLLEGFANYIGIITCSFEINSDFTNKKLFELYSSYSYAIIIFGSNFSWFGELRQFCGFIFSWRTSSNHLVIR